MSGFKVIISTKTVCNVCGNELRDAEDWSRHRRHHMMDRLYQTEDGRRYIQMMQGILHDRPDKK